MQQGENLDYTQQNKKGKLQIISFIRKQYIGADFRDIYTGLHKAILKDGKLIGVSTNLNMVYNQFNQIKTA